MNVRAITAMLLAYAVPGAGHFYLGRRARAAAYFAIIVIMFVLGLSIDGTLYTLADTHGSLLRVLASLGSMGAGALYFIARAMGPHGNVTSATYEYGTTFTLSAGLMNLLLVLDCYDAREEGVSFLRSHMVLMFIYAVLTAVFFALLWRHEQRERVKLAVIIFCSLFFGGIVIGWLMFPHPLQ
jgi:cytochrome bd-type quinol oxidase subunit 2